jgi:hypothetical protein
MVAPHQAYAYLEPRVDDICDELVLGHLSYFHHFWQLPCEGRKMTNATKNM